MARRRDRAPDRSALSPFAPLGVGSGPLALGRAGSEERDDAEIAWTIGGSPIAYEIHIAELADGRRVVLRRWHRPREPERAAFLEARGAFLDANGVAAPRLLATTAHAGLYEFAPGALLGDTTGRSCRRIS